MLRTLILVTFCLGIPGWAWAQAPGVLHVKVILVDADGRPVPVPRHALLVSDNPATAPPRRIVTALDGTVAVQLRPGSYIVESDEPVAFGGKAYQWTQLIEIVAGRDAVLELNAGNAEVGPVTSPTTVGARPEDDPSFLLPRWQGSVVALWTPTTRASGSVVDPKGFVLTSQRAVGDASSIEVQLTSTLKVTGRLLAADPARDVAVFWIDPQVAGSVPTVPMQCAPGATRPSLVEEQDIFAMGAPLRGPKELTPGVVTRVSPREVVADLRLSSGSAGGPVFAADGRVMGVTSILEETGDVRTLGEFRIIGVDAACTVLASAEQNTRDGAAPASTHLPVEPLRPFPVEALKDAAIRRAGSLMPYEVSSSDFNVAFITPVLLHGAQQRWDQAGGSTGGDPRSPDAARERMRLLTDFANWSEYVADVPPVLLVRATPKLVEGFWTKVARGAARTQGVSIPPIKRFKSGFSRMQVFCGNAEVTPIHPFKLAQPVSENEVIYEGLYVFDPGALGPHCRMVKLVLFSEKAPRNGDARDVDPKIIQQVWQDFEPLRGAKDPDAAGCASCAPTGRELTARASDDEDVPRGREAHEKDCPRSCRDLVAEPRHPQPDVGVRGPRPPGVRAR